MTEDYVQAKAREALKATGGDKKDAQKLLVTWAVRDQALLLGLTKPHLKALAAAQIEGLGRKNKEDPAPMPIDQLGEKRRAIKVPPPKSSARQASVMHQLVAAFKKKG